MKEPTMTPIDMKASQMIQDLLDQYMVVLFTENATEEYGLAIAQTLKRRKNHFIVQLDGIPDPTMIPSIRKCLETLSGYNSLPVVFVNGQVVPQVSAIAMA